MDALLPYNHPLTSAILPTPPVCPVTTMEEGGYTLDKSLRMEAVEQTEDTTVFQHKLELWINNGTLSSCMSEYEASVHPPC